MGDPIKPANSPECISPQTIALHVETFPFERCLTLWRVYLRSALTSLTQWEGNHGLPWEPEQSIFSHKHCQYAKRKPVSLLCKYSKSLRRKLRAARVIVYLSVCLPRVHMFTKICPVAKITNGTATMHAMKLSTIPREQITMDQLRWIHISQNRPEVPQTTSNPGRLVVSAGKFSSLWPHDDVTKKNIKHVQVFSPPGEHEHPKWPFEFSQLLDHFQCPYFDNKQVLLLGFQIMTSKNRSWLVGIKLQLDESVRTSSFVTRSFDLWNQAWQWVTPRRDLEISFLQPPPEAQDVKSPSNPEKNGSKESSKEFSQEVNFPLVAI